VPPQPGFPIRYVVILVALLLLTGLTVGISFVGLEGKWHIALGLSIGLCKAILVALFFMHLLHSPTAVRAVVLVSVFWLLGVLFVLTFSDYATRDLPPYVPGH